MEVPTAPDRPLGNWLEAGWDGDGRGGSFQPASRKVSSAATGVAYTGEE